MHACTKMPGFVQPVCVAGATWSLDNGVRAVLTPGHSYSLWLRGFTALRIFNVYYVGLDSGLFGREGNMSRACVCCGRSPILPGARMLKSVPISGRSSSTTSYSVLWTVVFMSARTRHGMCNGHAEHVFTSSLIFTASETSDSETPALGGMGKGLFGFYHC